MNLGNWLFLAQLDLFKGAALGEPSPSQQERKKEGNVGREEIHNLDVSLIHFLRFKICIVVDDMAWT